MAHASYANSGLQTKLHGHSVRCREWTQEQIAAAERGVVAVLYASAYGNTAALAQAISRGVTKAGELAVCFRLLQPCIYLVCVTGARRIDAA